MAPSRGCRALPGGPLPLPGGHLCAARVAGDCPLSGHAHGHREQRDERVLWVFPVSTRNPIMTSEGARLLPGPRPCRGSRKPRAVGKRPCINISTTPIRVSLTRDAARDAFGQVVRGEVIPSMPRFPFDRPSKIRGDRRSLALPGALSRNPRLPAPGPCLCDIVGTGETASTPSTSPTTSGLVAAACGSESGRARQPPGLEQVGVERSAR